jgi:tripartite-type tricarboxylate transporter receptor subunit TctC
MVKRLLEGGVVPMRETPDAFAKRVLDDDAKWREVVKKAGVTPH